MALPACLLLLLLLLQSPVTPRSVFPHARSLGDPRPITRSDGRTDGRQGTPGAWVRGKKDKDVLLTILLYYLT